MEIKEFAERVAEGQMNVFDITKKILPDGKENVTVSLANNIIPPERAESPPRAHVFFDINSFGDYIEKVKTDHTRIFCDEFARKIRAVIDESATDGFEVVRFKPVLHPQFDLLQYTVLQQSPMSVTQLAKALMRNRGIITEPPARDLILLLRQITISSSVTAKSGSGNSATNGVMVHTKVKAGYEDDGTEIDIPDSVRVKLPIWLYTDPVEFDLVLTVEAGTEHAICYVDTPELDIRKYEVFRKLTEQLAGESYFGSFKTKDWEYVKGVK